ncbi:MAG TPA: L,D-transpeptidase, partial [Alphaproteobacteria bacterium]|nr:L,D-transpeptidase [Alphaproteobacteria bacterium]
MRRQVGTSEKLQVTIAALAVAGIILASVSLAAEAKRVAIGNQQVSIDSLQTAGPAQTASRTESVPAIAQATASQAQIQSSADAKAQATDEVAAEQATSRQETASGKDDPSEAAEQEQPQSSRQIVISLLDRKLALVEDGQVLKVYPVAVGATGTPSPEGDFNVINHAVNPTYRHEGKVIKPGKDNPLGTRWMG